MERLFEEVEGRALDADARERMRRYAGIRQRPITSRLRALANGQRCGMCSASSHAFDPNGKLTQPERLDLIRELLVNLVRLARQLRK